MFRTYSTVLALVAAGAAVAITGIATAWSGNAAIYIFGPIVVFVLAARVFAGFSPISFGGDEKKIDAEPGVPDDDADLDRYPVSRRPGLPSSNNELLASAYAEASANGMTGEAMERFAKVAKLVDEDENGDPAT